MRSFVWPLLIQGRTGLISTQINLISRQNNCNWFPPSSSGWQLAPCRRRPPPLLPGPRPTGPAGGRAGAHLPGQPHRPGGPGPARRATGQGQGQRLLCRRRREGHRFAVPHLASQVLPHAAQDARVVQESNKCVRKQRETISCCCCLNWRRSPMPTYIHSS